MVYLVERQIKAQKEETMNNSQNPSAASSTIAMTPDLARLWLKEMAYGRQRDLKKSNLAEITQVIASGKFRNMEVRIARLPDGTGKIVDGYHRLNALINAGATLKCLVIEHPCTDERDVAELYSSFDRGSRRNFYDSFKAFGLLEKLGLNKREVTTFSAAIPILMSEFRYVDTDRLDIRSATERAKVAEEWVLEAIELFAVLDQATGPTRHLLERGPTIAVGLATMRYQESTARKFWGSIARDEGLVRTDPAWTLLNWFRSARGKQISPHIYARHIGAAWNSYYEGRPLAKLIVRAPEVKLLGTPYRVVDGRSAT